VRALVGKEVVRRIYLLMFQIGLWQRDPHGSDEVSLHWMLSLEEQRGE